MPDLVIKEQVLDNGIILLNASGFLDAYTFVDLEEKVHEVYEKGLNKIIIQLDSLTYISSAGAGVFISTNQMAADAGGKMVILSPSQNVYEVFELLGLTQIFTFTNDLEQAKAAVAS